MPSFIGWVPTPEDHVKGFFELAPVSPSDVVYDLGSGDGRLLFAALEKGAGRAVGVELNPELINKARETALSKGLDGRVNFLNADVMDVDFKDATLIFCYLISEASAKLGPKFEAELKPGTRVVMESFAVPNWKIARTFKIDWKEFYLYNIPPEKTE